MTEVDNSPASEPHVEEDDEQNTPDDDKYPGLLCLLQCLNTRSRIMPEERSAIVRRLATRSSKAEPLLRYSLFPNMPPSVIFYIREKKTAGPNVKKPPARYRDSFKWCHSTLLSHIMRRTLKTSHFEFVPEDSEWRGYWGKHLRSADYKTLTYWQKVNHFPGDFHLGRKDRLWMHLRELSHCDGFNIMPHTYVLPKDYQDLANHLSSGKKHVILKPPASARGRGITIVSEIEDVPLDSPIIAQHYIERPLIVNGSKFDLRLYVYVPSLDPLRIYIYNDGLVRFASVPYSAHESFNNQYMHLTNFSINKLAKKNGVADASPDLKWPLQRFWEYVEKNGHSSHELWEKIKDVAVRSVLCCAASIRKQQTVYCDFPFLNREVFGMDILVDENFKPWILEMNISPSMQTATEEDVIVKAPLVADLLNIWRMEFLVHNDPVALDQSYRSKPLCCHKNEAHLFKELENVNYFKNKGSISPNILLELTDADLRYLIDFEDEFALRGGFDLIYPATPTLHEYICFVEPSYANLLLIAWMQYSSHDHNAALNRLRSLAEGNAHLSDEGPDSSPSELNASDTDNVIDEANDTDSV